MADAGKDDLFSQMEAQRDSEGSLAGKAAEDTDVPRSGSTVQSIDLPASELRPGIRFGAYLLEKELGRGGMGQVWLAQQQEPVVRRVALKIIRSQCLTERSRARFLIERQALAVLDHPHIARILDAGTTSDGIPFFVMDLVDGLPITTFCDSRKLSIRERLELCLQVCEAVEHAHQRGVIHRDLKPNNILVSDTGGKPSVRVIDFGLAKLVGDDTPWSDESSITQFGQILGTLRYMSPEQAKPGSRDIDVRTDVYALGTILYELLTGTTPIDRQEAQRTGTAELLAAIRSYDPPKPSQRIQSISRDDSAEIAANRRTDQNSLNRHVSGDLDWIVMKSLEKDRQRRYSHVSALGDDILRFLNSEPIVARPPSLVYRSKKFVRKNRLLVSSSAAVLLALTLGLAGTSWGLWRASVALAETRQANRDLETKSKAEQAAYEVAEQRLQEMETANEILASVFDQANLSDRNEYKESLEKRLSQGLLGADDLLKALEPNGNRAIIRSKLASSLLSLGLLQEAVEILQETTEQLEQDFGSDHPETTNAMHQLGMAIQATGDYPKAVEIFEERHHRLTEILGEEDPVTLSAAVDLADARRISGMPVESEAELLGTVEAMKRSLGPNDSKLLDAEFVLAGLLRENGKMEQAEQMLKGLIQRGKESLGDDHLNVLGYEQSLASLLTTTGQTERALQDLESLRDRVIRKLGASHPLALRVAFSIVDAQIKSGVVDDVEAKLRNVLGDYAAAGLEDHPQAVTVRTQLAFYLLRKGDDREGLRLVETNLKLTEQRYGEDTYHSMLAMANLGGTYAKIGQGRKGVAYAKKAFQRSQDKYGQLHPHTVSFQGVLGNTYMGVRNYKLAAEVLEDALKKQEQVLGESNAKTLTTAANLGVCYLKLQKFDKAIPLLKANYEREKVVLGEDHPDTLISLGSLAAAYRYLNELQEALPRFEEVAAGHREIFGLDHMETWASLSDLAVTYRNAGEFERALKIFRELGDIYAGKFPEGHATRVRNQVHMGACYVGVGRYEEGIRELKQAIAATGEHFEAVYMRAALRAAYAQAGMREELQEALRRDLPELRSEFDVLPKQLAEMLEGVATDYFQVGDDAKAEALLREVWKLRGEESSLGWQQGSENAMLGSCLLGQIVSKPDVTGADVATEVDLTDPRLLEASDRLEEGLAGMEDNLKQLPQILRRDRVQRTLQDLVSIAEIRQQPEQVQRWKNKQEELLRRIEEVTAKGTLDIDRLLDRPSEVSAQ